MISGRLMATRMARRFSPMIHREPPDKRRCTVLGRLGALQTSEETQVAACARDDEYHLSRRGLVPCKVSAPIYKCSHFHSFHCGRSIQFHPIRFD